MGNVPPLPTATRGERAGVKGAGPLAGAGRARGLIGRGIGEMGVMAGECEGAGGEPRPRISGVDLMGFCKTKQQLLIMFVGQNGGILGIMKVVNLGDPFTRRITLRLTELQYKHLVRMAEEMQTSPSDYIRYLVTQSAISFDREMMMEFNPDFVDYMETGGTSNENVKAGSDDNI